MEKQKMSNLIQNVARLNWTFNILKLYNKYELPVPKELINKAGIQSYIKMKYQDAITKLDREVKNIQLELDELYKGKEVKSTFVPPKNVKEVEKEIKSSLQSELDAIEEDLTNRYNSGKPGTIAGLLAKHRSLLKKTGQKESVALTEAKKAYKEGKDSSTNTNKAKKKEHKTSSKKTKKTEGELLLENVYEVVYETGTYKDAIPIDTYQKLFQLGLSGELKAILKKALADRSKNVNGQTKSAIM